MIYNLEDQVFLEQLAQSDTGKGLIKLLKNFEIYHADIRNLDGIDPKVRIDALKMIREGLINKLLILSGQMEEIDNNEFV